MRFPTQVTVSPEVSMTRPEYRVKSSLLSLGAHTYLGSQIAKLDAEEIALNRKGRSHDPRAEAAVSLAVKVTRACGKVEEDNLAGVRAASYTDAKIIKIVVLCAQFFPTNFLANVFDIDVDFPTTNEANTKWSIRGATDRGLSSVQFRASGRAALHAGHLPGNRNTLLAGETSW